jgi:hypothetical protein
MSDLHIDLRNCTDDFIADTLRRNLRQYDTGPLKSWRWWGGFICGAIFMAAMNIGDVHLCVGECDSVGVSLVGDAK